MLRRPIISLPALLLLVLPAATHGAVPSGLEPYAGSYSGTAVATSAGTTERASSTLTFTGRRYRYGGTFLYAGILNQSGTPLVVAQTFRMSAAGRVVGTVTVGAQSGTGAGSVKLVRNRLIYTLQYKLTDVGATVIELKGDVKFYPRRAVMNATVTSADPTYSGKLRIVGKR